jgi:uncharacterized membrane protein
LLDQLINSTLSKELITVILAMLPVAELRLSLPLAITVFHMSWYEAFGLSVLGNLIPVPFLLLFFDAVSKLVQKNRLGKRFIDWLLSRTAKKTGSIEKYKHLGLIVFVAIPLPLTGAWTASLAAYILGLKFRSAFIDIILGVVGAGIIVTALTLLGWWGAAIALTAIIVIAVLRMLKTR